jgi:hypothetical protein
MHKHSTTRRASSSTCKHTRESESPKKDSPGFVRYRTPLYPHRILVVWGTRDVDSINAILLKNKFNGWDKTDLPEGIDARHVKFSHGSFIWLKHKPVRASQIGCLAHELVHALAHLQYRTGLPLMDTETEEVHAYILGQWVEAILKLIWGHDSYHKGTK